MCCRYLSDHSEGKPMAVFYRDDSATDTITQHFFQRPGHRRSAFPGAGNINMISCAVGYRTPFPDELLWLNGMNTFPENYFASGTTFHPRITRQTAGWGQRGPNR